ncbi:MAG: GDP-L-fucose synthase [Hoeflea sp.]|uniref:GDP-L-fucose synthase n=1 Tax=Hoeflea sp. TaxID=1940281 RepID=UPI0032EF8741
MAETPYTLTGKKVYVAGHRGMVGSAIVRRLATEGCSVLTSTRSEVDLSRQASVENWFAEHRPDAVFLAAAKVGGILANDRMPADFLYENLMIEANIIHAAHKNGTEKLLFLGSSCIYPKFAGQPIPEDALLTGPLEPTNEWYAIAKIAGIKLCQAYRKQHGADFISAMPTNLYGTGDNYDPETSHVLPALIRKVHQAKTENAPSITLWGSGTPLREFLHADDCADALVFLMQHYSGHEHVNVGSGHEITIRDLALMIAEASDYSGTIELDRTKPDGTPRKLMDSSRLLAMGWQPSIGLEAGIRRTLAEFEGLID